MHRVGVVSLLANVRIQPALQQLVDHREMTVLSRRVQQRPFVLRRTHVQHLGVLVEERGECREVAVPRGLEESVYEVRHFLLRVGPHPHALVRSLRSLGRRRKFS